MRKKYWHLFKTSQEKASIHRNKILDLDNYVDERGNEYHYLERYVFVKREKDEQEFAEWFILNFNSDIYFVPKVLKPKNIKTPDFRINDIYWEFKHPFKCNAISIENRLRSAVNQSKNVIIYLNVDNLNNCLFIHTIYETRKRFPNIFLSFERIIFINSVTNTLLIYKNKQGARSDTRSDGNTLFRLF